MEEQKVSLADLQLRNIDVIQQLCDYEKKPDVETYLSLKKEQKSLIEQMEKEEKRIQNECEHPIWYHLKTEDDDHEGRRYFTCRCLRCDNVEENRANHFKSVVFTKQHISTVKREYNILKGVLANPALIFQGLTEKLIQMDNSIKNDTSELINNQKSIINQIAEVKKYVLIAKEKIQDNNTIYVYTGFKPDSIHPAILGELDILAIELSDAKIKVGTMLRKGHICMHVYIEEQ